MKSAILAPSLFLLLFTVFNYQVVLGFVAAQIEIWRLRIKASGSVPVGNPPNANDSFENALSALWETRVINGSGRVDPGPEFLSGSYQVKDGSLILFLRNDPDFHTKPWAERYNNVALIGFRGYSPAPNLDIVARATMQAGPGFFGTAGVVFEPVNTLLPDGSFKPNGPFNMFGASIVGPESNVQGYSGAICSRALNWWPSASSLGNIDIYEPHLYEIRLQWLSQRSWLGIISVDGTERSRMELPPFGPVEIQIWSDGYKLSTSPWWKLHLPKLGFQNGEKYFKFDAVEVRSEPQQ